MAVDYPGSIQELINSSGPKSIQDGASADYPNLVANFADSSMAAAASESAGPLVGKIVLGQGGFYDVQMADGTYRRRVPNQQRGKLRIDSWVTITQVEGRLAITGPGAVQG